MSETIYVDCNVTSGKIY